MMSQTILLGCNQMLMMEGIFLQSPVSGKYTGFEIEIEVEFFHAWVLNIIRSEMYVRFRSLHVH